MTRDRLIEAMARAIAENPAPPNRIQGFHYPPHFVVRDVYLPPDKQELYRGPDTDEASFEAALRHARAMFPARAALAAIEANGAVVVPRKLLAEAHACMRECGWHLAPASAPEGDGVLNLAVAEIEAQVGALLAASPFAPEARDE